jgi:hypothetical protein
MIQFLHVAVKPLGCKAYSSFLIFGRENRRSKEIGAPEWDSLASAARGGCGQLLAKFDGILATLAHIVEG